MISTLVSEPSYVLVDGGLATADVPLEADCCGDAHVGHVVAHCRAGEYCLKCGCP